MKRKKIVKLLNKDLDEYTGWRLPDVLLVDKINEIIDKVNALEEKQSNG